MTASTDAAFPFTRKSALPQVTQDLLSRFLPTEKDIASEELDIAVVGGGPAGLLLTWKLLDAGHKVTVFEKREAYRLNQASDSRSYNLTADGLGLRAFGRLGSLIYCAGIIVDGRAIHCPSGSLWTHPYGHRASDHLVSIARGDLLALLAATIIDHPKCKLHFNCKIDDADVDQGTIEWQDMAANAEHKLEGLQLIAFADGVRGLGRSKALNEIGTGLSSETEQMPYLKATISKEAASEAKLDLSKIHFFPSNESLGIGLPNYDGTISVLIEGYMREFQQGNPICPFTGKSFTWNRAVFTNPEEVDAYLKRQNPKLAQCLKNLPDQAINQRPGYFTVTYVNDWRIGQLGVLVGDAGGCAPPWAGFGMNLACSHAADLARLIGQHRDLNTALDQYNDRRCKCTKVVQRIIKDHGALLNSGIGTRKWRREQAVRDRREQVLGERSEYQIVAFEDLGLEELAGLD